MRMICLAAAIGRLHRADHLAVAQHRDAVADFKDFFQTVTDKEYRRTLGSETARDAEEVAHFTGRKGGGWLVHDEHAGILRKSAGHLHHLLVGNRQTADSGAGSMCTPSW